MGEPGIPGRLDEEILPQLSPLDTINMQETQEKTREEVFAESTFEWVKTERSGDVCRFAGFELEGDVEYTLFEDNSRIRTDLIGDIVLMHKYSNEVLGSELRPTKNIFEGIPTEGEPVKRNIFEGIPVEGEEHLYRRSENHAHSPSPVQARTEIVDPVVSILEKTKKRNEKIALTLTIKIPSPDLYNVIKENFENVDEILLDNVMEQIHQSMLRDAVKRELQTIYSPKKKKQQQ